MKLANLEVGIDGVCGIGTLSSTHVRETGETRWHLNYQAYDALAGGVGVVGYSGRYLDELARSVLLDETPSEWSYETRADRFRVTLRLLQVAMPLAELVDAGCAFCEGSGVSPYPAQMRGLVDDATFERHSTARCPVCAGGGRT